MLSSLATRRGRCAVLAACAAPFLTSSVFGGINFNTSDSSVKITHYADNTNGAAFGSKNVVPPPLSGSMPVPASYQYSKTLTLGSGSSSASASIGAITNSQNVGFTFASGTGVTQTDNSSSLAGPAQLKFQVNGAWDVTSGGFGPTAYGYIAFTLGGVVPSGDTASISVNLHWTDGSGTDLRSPFIQTKNFPADATLPYTVSSSARLNTGSVTGGQIKVNGTITFLASDPGATISLQPLDFEMSAAPPTYRFQNASSDFFSPSNWSVDQQVLLDNAAAGPYPDFAGARAYFGPTNNSSTSVSIQDAPLTLGMLDINRGGLNLGGTAPLTFDTQANNAVLFARNVGNFTGQLVDPITGTSKNVSSGENIMTMPVVLNKDLEAIIDSDAPMTVSGQISGPGGIIKSGLGELILQGSNTFAGGITINSGMLTAAGDGALSSSTININGGALSLNVLHPFAPGSIGNVAVHANAQVDNFSIGANGVQYHIDAFGAILADGNHLQNLVLNQDYFPAPNSMIAHLSFDPNSGLGNPTLTNDGSLIFGIGGQGTNFVGSSESLTVGSASGTPWGGLGGDQNFHIFGGAAGQILKIAGTAQLVSLGGQLSIKAPISDPPPAPQLFKNGAGLVSIDGTGNTFNGNLEVQTGPLAINADWAGPITVDGGASLGGTGNINAPITFVDSPTTPSVFTPGVMGPVANGPAAPNNQTINGPGTLHSLSAIFSPHTHLVYDLNTANTIGGADNDLLTITGNLTLAGILDVNEGDNFGPGTYTLMTYSGTLSPQTPQYPTGYLQLGIFDFDAFPGAMVLNIPNGAGGSIVLSVPFAVVPEPTSATLLLLGAIPLMRRKRRDSRAR